MIGRDPKMTKDTKQEIHPNSNTCIDSLHFKIDPFNDWMLEATLALEKLTNQIKTALKLVRKTYVPLKHGRPRGIG